MANAKIDVDIGSFTSNINTAKNILKSLNAEMKATDAEFKATGNAEQKLTNQTKTLNSQIRIQKGVIAEAEAAMKAMTEAGVDPADAEFQKFQATMMNATAGMYQAKAALNELNAGAGQAADGANELTKGLNGISKKISLDQVISGIGRITDGLENATKKAIALGKSIWENITDTARYSDDIATSATTLGMSIEDYQRYKGVFDTVGEITVQEWTKARNKVQKAIVDTTDEQFDIFAALGVGLRNVDGTVSPYYNKYIIGEARAWEDVFWDVGAKLRENVANGKLTQDQADVYAQALFGGKWSQYNSLFELGREGFLEAFNAQNVASEEAIKKNAELNDQLIKLQASFDALKAQTISELAPVLSDATKALDGLLGNLLEYMQTEDGKKMLQDLGTAVSGLFEDLGKIDPQGVIKGFTEVFTSVTNGIKWLVEHEGAAKAILGTVVGAWGTLTIGENVLKIMKMIDGIKTLTTGNAAVAGAAAGSSWATSFAASASSVISSIAPWLASVLGVTAVAITPALVANAADRQRWQSQYNERAAAAALGGPNSWFINQANDVFGLTGQTQMDTAYSMLMGLSDRQNQQRAELYNLLNGRFTSEAGNTWNALNALWNGEAFDSVQINAMLQDITDAMAEADNKPKVTVEPVVPDNTAEDIQEQVGVVPLFARITVASVGGSSELLNIGYGGGGVNVAMPKANGMWSVPYDGYMALLHKGERVTPAREVQSRSYNSNLYVESMVMNNGTDAAGLASAMAAAQRRQMSGFGS